MRVRRNRHIRLWALLLAISTATCEPPPPPPLLAQATFDDDPVDAPPDATLPETPVGDALLITGDGVRVRSTPTFITRFVEITRGGRETSLRLAVAPNATQRYTMTLTGVVLVDEAATAIRFVAGTAGELRIAFLRDGRVVVMAGDTPQEVGTHQTGTPHTITVTFSGTQASLTVAGATTTQTPGLALTPTTDTQAAIALAYPAMLLEAFRASYGVDRMQISGS